MTIFEITSSGNVNDDLDFEYGDGTTVAYGCGATFMGEFWYFGGDGAANNRQVITSVQDRMYRSGWSMRREF